MKTTDVGGALREGAAALKGHRCKGVNAAKDAEMLLLAATGLRREDLVADPRRPIAAAEFRRYRAMLRRRAAHEPMAYLTGTAWFLGREFRTDRRALIPRWATEHVVLAALASAPVADATFDVGTGSGCIAVSLAVGLPGAKTYGIDRSVRALAAARSNARRLIPGRIRFLRGDLLAPVRRPLTAAARPLIVANLPYLPTRAVRGLPPDIRAFEPAAALDGGADGLGLYRRMLRQLAVARPGGRFVLLAEILPGQYAPLSKIVRARFHEACIARVKNYSGVTVGLSALA